MRTNGGKQEDIKQYWKYLSPQTSYPLYTSHISIHTVVTTRTKHYHAVQTVEMIRKDGHPEWMQLIGLLHNVRKIMYKKNEGSKEQ